MENESKLDEAVQLLKDTFLGRWNENTFRLATALTFYTILSLTPLLISFFGAEFTQVYARRHGRDIVPLAHARRAGRNSNA